MKFWDFVLRFFLHSFFPSSLNYQNGSAHWFLPEIFSALTTFACLAQAAVVCSSTESQFQQQPKPCWEPLAIAVALCIAAYRAHYNPCRELIHSGLLWQHHPCGRSCWGQSWLQFPAPLKLPFGRVNFDCFCCLIQGTLLLQNDLLPLLCYWEMSLPCATPFFCSKVSTLAIFS